MHIRVAQGNGELRKVKVEGLEKIAFFVLCKTFLPRTVSEHQCHTPSREERRFLYFNHLSKEFLEQMIPHLKALI